MSHSQFHCTVRVYLDLHGLIFETSICYWQDQPGSHPFFGVKGEPGGGTTRTAVRAGLRVSRSGDRPARVTRFWGPVDGRPMLRLGNWSGFWSLCRVRETWSVLVLCRRHRCALGGKLGGGRARRYRRPAAGSVVGPLGQTGRLGLATERATGELEGSGGPSGAPPS